MADSSSLMPSLVALSFPALAAIVLTAIRPHIRMDRVARSRFLIVLGLTIIGQFFHFVEELLSELYVELPSMFGFPPVSESFFMRANLAFLAIWVVALFALRRGIVIGLLPLWFLGWAELLNLFLHPVLALWTGGYFPGVVTAPIVGVLGILSLKELFGVTTPHTTADAL